ncbi:MAG: hypothetical protein KatS3mg007_1757 [Thermoanaerobaculum sp.]|nr:MAG: hypothetical protein KatS3mg007_1757 [Thermoanaerobaculum sp.]
MSVRPWLVFGGVMVLAGFFGALLLEDLLSPSIAHAWHLYGDSAFALGKELLFVSRPKYWTGGQVAECGRVEMYARLEGRLLGGNQGGLFVIQHACVPSHPKHTSCDEAVRQLAASLGLKGLTSTLTRDIVFGEEVDVLAFEGKTEGEKAFLGEGLCLQLPRQRPPDASTWILWSISSQERRGLLRRATRPKLWDLVSRSWRQPILVLF